MSFFSKKSGSKGFSKSSSSYGGISQPQIPDAYADGSLTWSNLAMRVVGPMADQWFSEYSPTPITSVLRREALEYSEPLLEKLAPFHFGENEKNLIPGLTVNFEDFGEQADIDKTELGRALLEVLKEAGVAWFYETRFPISPFESIELPDAQTEGTAQWGNYFGMPVQQRFRIYVDDNGKETCVWFSPMLVATRPFEHMNMCWARSEGGDLQRYEISEADLSKGALTFGQWSTEVFIPNLATGLFYLAETAFPSSLFAMPREFTYEEAPEAERPRPFLVNARHEETRGVFDDTGAQLMYTSTLMPNVIHFGWSFTTTDKDSILRNVETISDGLVKISSILEDGYLNSNSPNDPYRFDAVLLSAVELSPPGESNEGLGGYSRWVPTTRVGFLMHESNNQSALAFKADGQGELETARRLFEFVSFDGAGSMVPNCVNSLVFGWLLGEENWDLVDSLLEGAYLMKMGRESINALSNWGMSKYMQGLPEEAKEKFELVLASEDQDSENEACYYLSLIAKEQGDQALADQFEDRCARAGGYNSVPGRKAEGAPVSSRLSKSSSEESEGLRFTASFCSNCGTKFDLATARFCSNCGSQR